jgi:HK97 family phage major capsid protein
MRRAFYKKKNNYEVRKMDYMAKINELTASKTALISAADKLIAENSFGEDLTKLQGEIKDLSAQIAQVTDLAAASAAGAVAIPAAPAEPKNDNGLRLFGNFADQLRAVKNAAGGVVDERLLRLNKEFKNASGMNEGIGTEGGFAVQTDFAGLLMDSAAKAGNILPLVDRYEVSSGANAVKWVEVDESTVATTVFGGVQVYWASEAAAVTASKPVLAEKELKLEKLMGIAYATYELDSDSGFVSQLYSRAFSLGIQRELEASIIAGTGIGKPIGILTSAGRVSVAAEAGQVASTVIWENISKMYNRARNKDQIAKYVWLVNPDVAEQLDFLSFPIGTGGVPVYLPAAQAGSVSTLKGRPVIETDHCSALGAEGDIMFADLSDYMLITKGGVKADTSIHLQFLAAENAFRFIFRANGMPKRNKTLTIKNSNNARSSIVTLAAR